MKDLFGNKVVSTAKLDRDILTKLFSERLKGITDLELVNMLYSPYEAIVDFAKLCNGESRTGHKISMLFNPHRWDTPSKQSKSIVQAFNDDSFLSGLARVTIFKDGKYNEQELFYQVLQLGIDGVQCANEFPPHIMRDCCIKFNATRVLDPCAGWGGRMIGVVSVGGYYHAFEPSTKTYEGLLKLGSFLQEFETGFTFKIENIPFEDAIIDEKYDFALTSPPYYDTEIYSDEETNSCNRYDTFEKWTEGFYLPMLDKTVKASEDFVINVGSRRYDLKSILFENYKNTVELLSLIHI